MATSLAISFSFLPNRPLTIQGQQRKIYLFHNPNQTNKTSNKLLSFRVQAAKLPAGVELPKVEPKFKAPFLGLTRTAEIWNSRACLIGLIGTFIVELIINKGILQVIGVDIGKGLDLPLRKSDSNHFVVFVIKLYIVDRNSSNNELEGIIAFSERTT